MEFVLSFSSKLISFLSVLYEFFFTPLSDVLAMVSTHFVVGTGNAFSETLIGKLMTTGFYELFNLFPSLTQITLAEFLMGSFVILFLLFRLVQFLLPFVK